MTRLLSGVLLAAAALAAVLFLPLIGLRVLVAAVAAIAADEYLSITGTRSPATRIALIGATAAAAWWASVPAALSPVILVLVGVGWLAVQVMRQARTIQDAAVDLTAPLYIGLPLGMLVAVHALASWRATLLLIGTIVVSDSGQFYTGRAFGRRALAPAISPKKTVEGAVGGVILGTLFMVVAGAYAFPSTTWPQRAMIGIVVVSLGILGDLFESRLKRVAGVKDSSSLIPGHGGVLDRIDALLFAVPAFYYMVLQSLA